MKTEHPLILTARIADSDLEPFDRLRKQHFPPDRNRLHAHLTMFHRLPGEHIGQVLAPLRQCAGEYRPFAAEVSGVRHLGAGVAFTIASPELQALRARLKVAFLPWLNPQDMQPWQPHITIQNKVERAKADDLHRSLKETFEPGTIAVTGLDLWAYLGGPWGHEATLLFPEGDAGPTPETPSRSAP